MEGQRTNTLEKGEEEEELFRATDEKWLSSGELLNLCECGMWTGVWKFH